MKKLLSIITLLSLMSTFHAQIVSSQNQEKKKKVVKTDLLNLTQVLYLSGGYFQSYRNVKVNDFLSNDLSEIEQEKSINSSIWGLGFKDEFKQYFFYDFGLSFVQHGEQLNVENADTNYAYINRYKHLSVPIQMGVFYGKRWRVFTQAGLQAQLLTSFSKEVSINNEKIANLSKNQLDKGTNLGIAFTGKSGLMYHAPKFFGELAFIYMQNLSNSYTNQGPYKHYSYGFGGVFSLGVKF